MKTKKKKAIDTLRGAIGRKSKVPTNDSRLLRASPPGRYFFVQVWVYFPLTRSLCAVNVPADPDKRQTFPGYLCLLFLAPPRASVSITLNQRRPRPSARCRPSALRRSYDGAQTPRTDVIRLIVREKPQRGARRHQTPSPAQQSQARSWLCLAWMVSARSPIGRVLPTGSMRRTQGSAGVRRGAGGVANGASGRAKTGQDAQSGDLGECGSGVMCVRKCAHQMFAGHDGRFCIVFVRSCLSMPVRRF